ncbi:MAG TPA: helix-turn-helix domain-containing protein [Ideonella sp.]|nr:helix-turn-helix domain-containing protein [Ideonella sp.]
MFTAPSAASPILAHQPAVAARAAEREVDEAQRTARRIAETLRLLEDSVPLQRRVVHAGDTIYQAGDRFSHLHVLNSGFFKIVNLSSDGREQVVGLHFKGDWLGFDGIANGHYGCDAIAMDTGEVWSIRYDQLLAACTARPQLLAALHAAMSREIGRDRDSMLSLCTLPADARVADFLRNWANALAQRGLRTDQINLRMTRAEIGNYLGMTLETVSRALSRLAKAGLICFAGKGRREIQLPHVAALSAYIQSCLPAERATLQ